MREDQINSEAGGEAAKQLIIDRINFIRQLKQEGQAVNLDVTQTKLKRYINPFFIY